MDFRRSYKAVFFPSDPDYPRIYYRNWWSIFWTYFGVTQKDNGKAYQKCLEHSTARKQTVNFGKLPPKESVNG